jgi:hypothetical protein
MNPLTGGRAMSQEIERVADSLKRLYGSGALSRTSADLLGQESTQRAIAAGLGSSGAGQEVLLVAILVDDSGSIALNLDEIHLGYERMLEALRGESANADVQVHVRALNRGVLAPYTPLARLGGLAALGYDGSRLAPQTPLFLQTLHTLGTVTTKAQEEEARGASVRTFTLIISDAGDNDPRNITAEQVCIMVTDMLQFAATNHIVAGMGVGEQVNFYDVFRSMGIPDKWIFSAGVSADSLRDKFRVISKSLALAAESEVAFLQLEAGPPLD